MQRRDRGLRAGHGQPLHQHGPQGPGLHVRQHRRLLEHDAAQLVGLPGGGPQEVAARHQAGGGRDPRQGPQVWPVRVRRHQDVRGLPGVAGLRGQGRAAAGRVGRRLLEARQLLHPLPPGPAPDLPREPGRRQHEDLVRHHARRRPGHQEAHLFQLVQLGPRPRVGVGKGLWKLVEDEHRHLERLGFGHQDRVGGGWDSAVLGAGGF